MPPEYASRAFWDARFRSENHFEWLENGTKATIPLITAELRAWRGRLEITGVVPKTLHLGAGTSTLSEQILVAYQEVWGSSPKDTVVVLDTDFSDRAVNQGPTFTFGGWTNAWRLLDALKWTDIVSITKDVASDVVPANNAFQLVVDKSTSDAISCGEDVSFENELVVMETIHPAVANLLHKRGKLVLPPLELLALHMAAVVTPGGSWIAVSYHSNRFSFLIEGGEGIKKDETIGIGQFWEVEAKVAIEAPSGQVRSGVHAPTVYHYVYLLRRTDLPACNEIELLGAEV